MLLLTEWGEQACQEAAAAAVAAGEFCSQRKPGALRKAHVWIVQGHTEVVVEFQRFSPLLS